MAGFGNGDATHGLPRHVSSQGGFCHVLKRARKGPFVIGVAGGTASGKVSQLVVSLTIGLVLADHIRITRIGAMLLVGYHHLQFGNNLTVLRLLMLPLHSTFEW